MQVTVGSHRFSGTDMKRTLVHALEFLDEFPEIAYAHQAKRRSRIERALAGVDIAAAGEARLIVALEIVWPELLSARDDIVAAGGLPPTATGRVDSLSVSDGGVPKRAVERVDVSFEGVVGDRQATRRHHGSPWQALCLWNVESIDQLAAEGHPIGYGDAGENVTMSGIDWPTVQPGTRLLIGSVLCEISCHAEPCSQNARWFSDRKFNRIHHRNGPLSRLYATVLRPGSIETGDAVVLEPAR